MLYRRGIYRVGVVAAVAALVLGIGVFLQNSVLGHRILGRQLTIPAGEESRLSLDKSLDGDQLYRSGCSNPYQDYPDGPYTIRVGTFPGTIGGRTNAELAQVRLMGSYLPLDQSGRQICPIIQNEWTPAPSEESSTNTDHDQDSPQPDDLLDSTGNTGNLLLTLGGFASLENAYLYALQLVLGSPSTSLNLSIDGFQILFDRQPIEIRPGDRKPEGLTPSLRTAVVVQAKAPVYRTPESQLPVPSRAFAVLSRGDYVLSGRTTEVCSNSVPGCLYWHQVIHGPEHNRGWMLASSLLDVQSGVDCPTKGCDAEVFLRRIMGHSDFTALDKTPSFYTNTYQSINPALALTSPPSGLITFDMWLLRHGVGRGRGYGFPARVGKLRVPENGYFSPDLRWRDNRPVLVDHEGHLLWTGPAIIAPTPKQPPPKPRLHTS